MSIMSTNKIKITNPDKIADTKYIVESDIPNPIGHYAKSKYLGEKYVIENTKDYLICRAGWMMGGGPKKDKKFIQKIMKQLKVGKKGVLRFIK